MFVVLHVYVFLQLTQCLVVLKTGPSNLPPLSVKVLSCPGHILAFGQTEDP